MGRGDDPSRTASPELNATVEGGGSAFVQFNRGKKCIALDPTKPEGNALAKRLIGTADIFVTNVRQQSLQKQGLDYESLSKEFPSLIYGHLTAFGRAGEMMNDPGYDFGAFWAQTGLMEIARSDDSASMPRFPGGIGDNTTGMQLVGGIFGALYHRQRTGEGQLVDACLMRAGLWSMSHPVISHIGGNDWAYNPREAEGENSGIRETTALDERRTTLTSAPFKCKDGIWIHLLGLEFWRHLPGLLSALGVTEEGLFGPGGLRVKGKEINWQAVTRVVDGIIAQRTYDEVNLDELLARKIHPNCSVSCLPACLLPLLPLLPHYLSALTSSQWVPVLKKYDVWHTKIVRFEEQTNPEDPAYKQSLAAGSFVRAPGVRHELLGSPVLLSKQPAAPVAGAAVFGAHTEEVLAELGVGGEEFERLKREEVVAVSKGTRPPRRS